MADIKITLETLYDILRNEKKREDLQKLDAAFFIDVVNYLKEKEALLKSKQESTEIFAAGERDKLEYELKSIRRMLKEIYEKREKKMMDIALNKSRTGSNIIDTSAMLHEEKEFYKRVLKTLDAFRRGILQNISTSQFPELPLEKSPLEERKEALQKELKQSLQQNQEEQKTKIKFTHPTPSFVWKDMQVYGPFDPGEEIEIYPEVAELIVRKGRAVKVA